MKERCIIRTMKPLASLSPAFDFGNRRNVNNNDVGKKNFHLIGILNPDEKMDEYKGWAVVAVPSKDFSQANDLHTNAQLKDRQILSYHCPKKVNFSRYCDNLNLDEYTILLLPVNSKTGSLIIQDGIRLEGNLTSGGPLRTQNIQRNFLEGMMMMEQDEMKDLKGWKADNFPLSINPFISSGEQWKSLIGCITALQEHLLLRLGRSSSAGGKRKLGFWIKNRKQNCSKKSHGFLKWITTKNRKGLRGGATRLRTHESEENEEEDHEIYDQEENDEKKLISGKKVFKKNNIGRKVKQVINFSEGRNMKKKEENEMEKGLQKQLVRIELKPDPMLQESSFQFCSGDLLRLKVTMYEIEKNMEKEGGNHQVEIDFVQNFMCETDTLNACRCRRITKVLKRSVVSDMKWEKGVHISGKVFALCWVPYRIPSLIEENSGEIGENEREVDGDFCLGALDEKFKVTSSRYELQIRFYEKDVLTACSCFSLNIMMKMKTREMETKGLSYCLNGDVLQVFQDDVDVEEEEDEERVISCCENMRMIKSLSAVEFDV